MKVVAQNMVARFYGPRYKDVIWRVKCLDYSFTVKNRSVHTNYLSSVNVPLHY